MTAVTVRAEAEHAFAVAAAGALDRPGVFAAADRFQAATVAVAFEAGAWSARSGAPLAVVEFGVGWLRAAALVAVLLPPEVACCGHRGPVAEAFGIGETLALPAVAAVRCARLLEPQGDDMARLVDIVAGWSLSVLSPDSAVLSCRGCADPAPAGAWCAVCDDPDAGRRPFLFGAMVVDVSLCEDCAGWPSSGRWCS